MPSTTSGSAAPSGVSRRTLTKGAAWSAPLLMVASAAQASAASPPAVPGLNVVTGQQLTVTRCQQIEAGKIMLVATQDGSPVAAGELVTVTLPQGLTFAQGGQSVTLTTTSNGAVLVPALVANGSSGNYSITATYGGASSATFVTVDAAPSTVYTVEYNGTTAATSITTGRTGQVYASNYYILDSAGALSVWGPGFGSTTPRKLSPIGVTMFDSWSKRQDGGAKPTGALFVAGGALYSVSGNGAAPAVTKVTGVAGSIVDIQSSEYGNFVLTSNGLYYWGGNFGSTVKGPVAGTAGATHISVGKADRYTGTAGIIVLADGSTRYWKTTGRTLTLATPSNQPTGTIASTVGGCTIGAALTQDGTLWLLDMATGQWAQKATGVSSFDMWSVYGGYGGGTYVINGKVTQFMRGYSDVAVQGLGGVVVTQLLAADGLYYALDSAGKLYQWKGNNDRTVGAATLVKGPTFPIADVGLWGEHLANDSYTGGGYLLGSTTC